MFTGIIEEIVEVVEVKKVKGNQIQIKLLKNSDHRLSEPFDLKVINESIASTIKKD